MNLAGVFAPLPTPFDERDQVDLHRLRAALPRWIASPLTGFVVLGSNGEIAMMTDDECDRVVETARALIPRGRPLIAGATRESTHAAIRAAKRAADLGADAVIVRTPCLFKPQMTQEALIRFYTAVADAAPVPLLLYNFTPATGVNLLPSTVATLAAHPNVIGIKESGSDIAQTADHVALTPPGFNVLSGSGSTFHATLCVGVTGGILAVAGVLPRECANIFELARAGRYDEALAIQRRILPMARLVSTGYGVPGLKAILKLTGCDMGYPRPPLSPIPETALHEFTTALAKLEEVPA